MANISSSRDLKQTVFAALAIGLLPLSSSWFLRLFLLPLLLIMAGVIGGLVAFGVIGRLVGPVALAVSFKTRVNRFPVDQKA